MNLETILLQKKPTILNRWIDLIVGTYPADTQRFLRKEKDRFSNPVGSTIFGGLEALYDGLVAGIDVARLSSSLDEIVKIRAVQDFTPSQAISFVLHLKKVIRDEIEKEALPNGISRELYQMESRIDHLVLMAFDLYTGCRKKVYELRVNEARRHVSGLLRRANLLYEVPESEPDL